MRITFLVGLLVISSQTVKAQTQDPQTFPLVVQFASHCCGVPSDTNIVSYVKCFKKSYKKESITAYKVGPMGREGEYYLAFPLKELSGKQAKNFIEGIKCVTIAPGDKGGINYEKDFAIDASRFKAPVVSKENERKF